MTHYLYYFCLTDMPAHVSDFQCTVNNWEKMVCTWKPPYNPVPTNYELSYNILNQTPFHFFVFFCKDEALKIYVNVSL